MNIICKSVLAAAAAGAAALAAAPSQAVDWGLAVQIASVEATYMPNLVTFTADRAVGTCAAGQQMIYSPTGATYDDKVHNANAVFSMLISAKLAGRPVVITGNNANCTVLYVNMH